jgi:SAM-dependent methyltransferase
MAGSQSHLHDEGMTAGPDTLTDEQRARWSTVLAHLVAAVPAGSPSVLIDGADGAALLADRLAAALRAAGRPCVRVSDAACATHADVRSGRSPGTAVVADGARWRDHVPATEWALTVRVRSAANAGGYRDDDAHVVVDLTDPAWPVIRHIDGWFAPRESWYRSETRAFFGARAGTWNTRFGDDLPAYTAAVADAGIVDGGVAVDVGCGTGRALPALRAAVGPAGTVIGVDLTPQMLAAARDSATAGDALLVLADARHLPLATASVDAVFAAGLVAHLPDPDAGLRELARVTRPGGRLVLFHPSGRAALAARHGRTLRPDEPLAETPLRLAAERTGWTLTTYDDAPHRFLAIAVRRAGQPTRT